MRDRYSRGGRGGGGGGGRGGRGGGGSGGQRRNNGRGRGRGGRRVERGTAQSGNLRERITVESGNMVLIDQFMLANPQFIDRLATMVDAEPEAKDEVVREFGGQVVALEPGTYRIERDPYAFSIIVHPEGFQMGDVELSKTTTTAQGQVFIDTRCLAMIDRELLDDASLLEKYQQLWFSGQDKACRDLIRDNGGAVRYGFQRSGDELGVYAQVEEGVICLWPDVIETDSPMEEAPVESAPA